MGGSNSKNDDNDSTFYEKVYNIYSVSAVSTGLHNLSNQKGGINCANNLADYDHYVINNMYRQLSYLEGKYEKMSYENPKFKHHAILFSISNTDTKKSNEEIETTHAYFELNAQGYYVSFGSIKQLKAIRNKQYKFEELDLKNTGIFFKEARLLVEKVKDLNYNHVSNTCIHFSNKIIREFAKFSESIILED